MTRRKKVGFNFFRPIVETMEGNTQLFNFGGIMESIRNDYLRARDRINAGEDPGNYKLVYTYNGEPARLADISIDVETQYYHLVFERLDYQVPSRTTLHGESKALDLEDDEYIGIDVNVLYDPENHIFMIQRNRSSLGPSGIEEFLRSMIYNFTNEFEEVFDLVIVSDNSARRRAFNQAAYRKIHFKVTGHKANGIIEKFVGTNRDANVDVDSVEISFSSKVAKDEKIDEYFVRTLLEEYVDSDDVKKLQIRAREVEDGIIEPIDLIDHKLQTFIEFDFNQDRRLNPISVFEAMKFKFDIDDGGFKNKVLRM